MAFSEMLNGRGMEPSGWEFTLPAETQWEYAAGGGNKSKGYKYSGSDNVEDVAWYDDNSGNKTHPVRQKKANGLGMHDMSGNIWEWCLDDWQISSNHTPEFTRGNVRNIMSPERVCRGGDWYGSARSPFSCSFGTDHQKRSRGNCEKIRFPRLFILKNRGTVLY